MNTKFRLYKHNRERITNDINIVNQLKREGWKIRYSELGKLL